MKKYEFRHLLDTIPKKKKKMKLTIKPKIKGITIKFPDENIRKMLWLFP